MIERLDEINRLLLAIEEVSQRNKDGCSKQIVIKQCQSVVLDGVFPDHKETIQFCKKLEIIEESENKLKFTPIGKFLLKANPKKMYKLTEDQKKIISKLLLTCSYSNEIIKKIMRPFKMDYENNTFFLHMAEYQENNDSWMLELLKQSRVLYLYNETLKVNVDFVRAIAQLLGVGILNQRKFDELSQIQKAVGDLGEKLVLEYERERLNRLGANEESKCIRIISKLNVAAGYDIESFDGKSSSLEFDRFIEVKSSTGDYVSFEWTRNEINKAKKLKDSYWIYFLGKVDLVGKNAKLGPLLFRDPIKTVLESKEFKKQYSTIIVDLISKDQNKIRTPNLTD